MWAFQFYELRAAYPLLNSVRFQHHKREIPLYTSPVVVNRHVSIVVRALGRVWIGFVYIGATALAALAKKNLSLSELEH